ncbi:HD domain-containing protein [Aggregicoccus sp. 17bor-14]|uniref:HD domain-containing protein n=1 Tax=Myxococcaceae TaxID=31 RepID=UPI00129C1E6F|nr:MULTISPECIES: HD domain-containing protein [Myxococcaceae]MBF5043803.1 HD domain-containing protein [Simulacricoccus sp. 17bor-14]MRI89556.1 HD domain-containing protein [Aggregicoccus sp. 17bor-14]
MPSLALLDVTVPDSRLAREVAQLVRHTASDLLFHHSTRVYYWAALSGRRKGLAYDPELLYAAAMFHDLGLTSHFRQSRLRFEVDGANAARDFLRGHGIAEADVAKVWEAIALHTTPGIPELMHAEAALLQLGAGMDVTGRTYEQFTDEERAAVTAAHPRGSDFERELIDAFYEGLKHRPDSTFGTFNDDFLACKDPHFQRGDLCHLILHSPWTR